MVNGLHSASRGMMNILQKQDVTSQNLAQAHTTGFKQSRVTQRAEVNIGRDDENHLRQKEYQAIAEVRIDFSQGSLIETRHDYDLALLGKGFFQVKGPEGISYTRGGSFSLDANGQLSTLTGKAVADKDGRPIVIRGDRMQIHADGGVFVDGQKLTNLGVVDFEDPNRLIPISEGRFLNPDMATNPMKPAKAEVQQGFMEASNMDPVQNMVAMIVQSRNFESDQRAVQAIDQTLSKAVNEVGRVG